MSRALVKRRTLLHHLGATAFLAAPVFRSALGEAQANAPQRLIVVTFPGGARQLAKVLYSTPDSPNYESTENSFTFDKYLTAFAPLESDLLFFDNIGDMAHGGHTMIATLTGDDAGFVDEEGVPFMLPPRLTSIDQAIAKKIGSQTRFSSLQLGLFTEQLDMESFTYKRCCYSSGVALQPVNDPVAVFDRLFAGSTAPMATTPAPGSTSTGPSSAYTRQKSILDLFASEIGEIKSIAGSSEQPKLDEHLTALRELEKSLPGGTTAQGTVPQVVGTSCETPTVDRSQGTSVDLPAFAKTMNELLYQSINCGLTRVASLQWLNSSGNPPGALDHLGISRTHHDLQHNPGPDLDKAQTWILTQIAALVQRLKNTPEGGGTLLDNCAVLILSEMGDGSLHSSVPSPALIAGKAGGAIRTGRRILCNAPLNNLYVSLGNAFGLNISSFGDPKICTGSVSLT